MVRGAAEATDRARFFACAHEVAADVLAEVRFMGNEKSADFHDTWHEL